MDVDSGEDTRVGAGLKHNFDGVDSLTHPHTPSTEGKKRPKKGQMATRELTQEACLEAARHRHVDLHTHPP